MGALCVATQNASQRLRGDIIRTYVGMQEINSRIADGNWQLSQTEFISLMGAHTILMTHACTTTGEQINGTDMGDRTCGGTGGKQRMFSWDNSFFQVQIMNVFRTSFESFAAL
jgi:hypothetical protein